MSFREAQGVVAQADSLWHEGKMYGVDDGDSAALAHAYETFGKYSVFSIQFSDTYAHACYHYGKLLRAKDNPVSAMQAFIAATHSRTRDYHILGRVYSNMGDICHLAGEFPLAYDMYERSGDMYLRNGDTLLYYYDLNNMAFELAVQGEKDKTYHYLNLISKNCSNRGITTKILETKAEACLYKQQYDSVIYYSNLLVSYGLNEPTIYLLLAQAYSFMMEYDSASYYAGRIIHQTNELYILNNALYILTNNDSTKDIKGVRETASERADIQKLIEIKRSKLSQAVQLLEQDLARTPDKRWLYAIIATIVIIGTGLLIYIRCKHRQHQLLSQQIDDLTQLNNAALSQHQQIVQEHTEYTNNLISQIEQNCIIITQSKNFPNNLCMKDFGAMCKIVDANFNMLASKLCHLGILNETEIRLCILAFLNANRDQISDILPYAKNGVGKLKYRVSQKMGIDGKDLKKSLMTMAINESLEAK